MVTPVVIRLTTISLFCDTLGEKSEAVIVDLNKDKIITIVKLSDKVKIKLL